MTTDHGTEPTIRVFPDGPAVARTAAERIAAVIGEAVARHGRADVATTGGSTPIAIYRDLATAPLRDGVPWDRVHIWFGDDRYVPRDHPLSNALLVDQALLDAAAFSGQSGSGASGIDVETGLDAGVPLPADQVHAFPCTAAIGERLGAEWCASTYADEIRAAVEPGADGWPAFDLVIVGVGPDGHVLSVFPGSPALTSAELGLAIPAPSHVEPHIPRVTLNPAILGAARELLVVVQGAAKADVLADVLGPVRDPARWPAQLARRAGATWLIDASAAARLPADAARA
jgi:6-phosphogluconolactonase